MRRGRTASFTGRLSLNIRSPLAAAENELGRLVMNWVVFVRPLGRAGRTPPHGRPATRRSASRVAVPPGRPSAQSSATWGSSGPLPTACLSAPFIPRGNATENRRHGDMRCWDRDSPPRNSNTPHCCRSPTANSKTRHCRCSTMLPRCCRGSPGMPLGTRKLAVSTQAIGSLGLHLR